MPLSQRLFAKLLHLAASGDDSGQEPAGEPWLDDDKPEAVAPSDIRTTARIDWMAAGVMEPMR